MNSRGDLNNKKLVLLLHGYGQSGEQILTQFSKYIPEEWTVIAFDGDHAVEMQKGDSTLQGFAWYLFDRETGKYLTKISDAVEHLVKSYKKLNLTPTELIIVGYSQGGYLAPYIAQKLSETKKVIGVNSRYRSEDLDGQQLAFVIDGVHGERDQIVETEKSRANHQQLIESGAQGEFVVVPRSGHKFDRALGKALRLQINLKNT